MKVPRGDTGSNNIKVAFVLQNRITTLTIEDEGELKIYEPKNEGERPKERLNIGVSYQGKRDDDPDRWSMNNKSRNALIDIFGDDTRNWVGKNIEITISGQGEYQHIVVDTMRTK